MYKINTTEQELRILVVREQNTDYNGGNYTPFLIIQNGMVIESGRFCRCRQGCSNTIPESSLSFDKEIKLECGTFDYLDDSYGRYLIALEGLRKAVNTTLQSLEEKEIWFSSDFELDDDF